MLNYQQPILQSVKVLSRLTLLSALCCLVNNTSVAGMPTLIDPSNRPASPATALVKIDSRLHLVNGGNATVADANVVVFDESFSNDVSSEDALKFPNSGENLGIKKANKVLVIEGRQPIITADTIFFQMWNMRQQQYRLEIIPQNLPLIWLAFIEDTYLHTSTPLQAGVSTSINFTINNTASMLATRFRIVFLEPRPLACCFTGISVAKTGNTVTVNWQLSAERDMQEYIVERSEDGSRFVAAGRVAPNEPGRLQYGWTDLATSTGIVYYRIRAVSKSGALQYSSIVKTSVATAQPAMSVYPNPVTGSMLNLQMTKAVKGNYQLRLMNAAGACVYKGVLAHAGNAMVHSILLPGHVTPGVYWLTVKAQDEQENLIQVLIQ